MKTQDKTKLGPKQDRYIRWERDAGTEAGGRADSMERDKGNTGTRQ